MTHLPARLAAALIGLSGPVLAQDDAVAEAIVDYMDFATYESGIILPQQIDQAVFGAATFVDTRDAEQYEAGHIPGAIHIEWREIPGRIDELPEDGMVILYCNTGSLSSQATFAARLMGRENVLVLNNVNHEFIADRKQALKESVEQMPGVLKAGFTAMQDRFRGDETRFQRDQIRFRRDA